MGRVHSGGVGLFRLPVAGTCLIVLPQESALMKHIYILLMTIHHAILLLCFIQRNNFEVAHSDSQETVIAAVPNLPTVIFKLFIDLFILNYTFIKSD